MNRFLRLLLIALLSCGFTFGFTFNLHAQDDTPEDIQDALQALVDGWSDGSAVSARITIPEGSWAAASGLVDVTGDKAATPDSQFRIGSISKTFLAVVLLQLADEGVLSLDQTAADWLDDTVVSQIANADTATLHELVTMTSGIAEYLNDLFVEAILSDPTHPWTAAEALEFAYGLEASFDPGEDYEYSNTNYLLLQLVIEAATGKPFHEVLRERVLEPAGLHDTYTQGYEAPQERFVRGYEDLDQDGSADDVTDINDGWGLADGGLISTTNDLTKFYTALFIEQTLLSEDMLDLMTDGGEYEYGTGLEVIESEDGLIYGHSGGVFGFTGVVYYADDYEAIAVVLYASTNLGDEDTDALFALIDTDED